MPVNGRCTAKCSTGTQYCTQYTCSLPRLLPGCCLYTMYTAFSTSNLALLNLHEKNEPKSSSTALVDRLWQPDSVLWIERLAENSDRSMQDEAK